MTGARRRGSTPGTPVQPAPTGATVACRVCGAGIRDRRLEVGETLRCRRCHEVVKAAERGHLLHVAWALATTGMILCVLSNVYPILEFNVAGNAQSNRILTGVQGLVRQGYWPVAAMVFFCAVAAPFLYFAAVWYVAGSVCTGRRWPLAGLVARAAERVAPWSLVPVFAIACLVSVVKLDLLGTVTWEAGIGWIALLAACSFALAQVFDREFVAKRLGRLP